MRTTCFSFALADRLPQPVCVPQMCALSWSLSLPAQAQGRPRAGATRWRCVGRLRCRMGRQLAPSRTCPHTLAVGNESPAGRAEQSLRVFLPVPRTLVPAETQDDAPGAVSEAEGAVELCPGCVQHGHCCGWEWARPCVPRRSWVGDESCSAFISTSASGVTRGKLQVGAKEDLNAIPRLKPVPRWGRAGGRAARCSAVPSSSLGASAAAAPRPCCQSCPVASCVCHTVPQLGSSQTSARRPGRRRSILDIPMIRFVAAGAGASPESPGF